MTNSKGYFELKADNNGLLLKILEELNLFSDLKQNGEIIIANIHEDLSALSLTEKSLKRHLPVSSRQKKQSLEAQFLELVKITTMKRLIAIEYYKNLTYRPFKVFTTLYFIILIALLFIGLVDIKFSEGFQINLKDREFIIFRKSGISQLDRCSPENIPWTNNCLFYLSGIHKPDV